MELTLEYSMIAIYLIFLLGIGWAFRRMNVNLSDYVRGGAQGTWWMVGGSMLMANVSAFTFTGNAGAAFEAGLSPLIIYVAMSAGFLVMWLFLAERFRQTRAYTFQDIVRERFGPEVEQFNGWQAVIMGPLNAAVQLWAVAVFMSSVLGLPVEGIIVVIGVVVVTYSTTGGRWAVMATDFFQSLILIPIALVVATLCLVKIGGVGAFLEHFQEPAVSGDFRFLAEPGDWTGDRFTPTWMLAIFLSTFLGGVSFVSAPHFLSVKDGREAKKAARLVFVLSVVGMVIWFIPPWTARFLYADAVYAANLDHPPNAAYSVAARELLPRGLFGVLMVAMFAATMSSMDTGLNGITGTIVRNIIPPIRRLTGREALSPKTELVVCKLMTIGLGALIITYSLLLATQRKVQMFDIYFVVAAVVGLPLSVPFVVSLFVRRLPRWSFFGIAGAALVPSLVAYLDELSGGVAWTVQKRILWILFAAAIGSVVCRCFYRYSSREYRERVERFFRQMETPVDYAREVEGNRDLAQMKLMGTITLLGGVVLLPLLFLSSDASSRTCTAFVIGFVGFVGGLLRWRAYKLEKNAADYFVT